VSYCTVTQTYYDLRIRFSIDGDGLFAAVDDLRAIPTARWKRDSRQWTIDPSHADAVERWAHRHFDHGEIRWEGGSRGHGTGSGGYRYSGGYAHHEDRQAAPRQPTKIEAAYTALHLLDTAPLWAAEAIHRAAVKQFHPDRGEGGDTATMARVNAAFDVVKASLS
jgi:hypothetical protein